ncbi:MAG: hypothetical protein AAF663_00135, partial [Planctomycetota bacterium]
LAPKFVSGLGVTPESLAAARAGLTDTQLKLNDLAREVGVPEGELIQLPPAETSNVAEALAAFTELDTEGKDAVRRALGQPRATFESTEVPPSPPASGAESSADPGPPAEGGEVPPGEAANPLAVVGEPTAPTTSLGGDGEPQQ